MTTPNTTTMTHPQTPATFCIWLQGFLEGAGGSLDANQLATLRAKLDTVFTHFDSNPDCDTLTGESEADEATGNPDPFDKYVKMLEEYESRKANKWVYDGPWIPQTWPTLKPFLIT